MSPSASRLFQPISGLLLFILVFTVGACGQKENAETASGPVKIDELASGLDHPWGMAFLPDGRLLVTERSGTLRIMQADHSLSDPLIGIPQVFAQGQGGLLDVAIDPDFESNRFVYLAFSEPGPGNTASTAVGRGKLEGNAIQNFTVLFRQEPKESGPNHFGGRIQFHEGYLFLAMGDRFQFDPAQDLSNHLGTIVRIYPDGSIPQDNPFVGEANAEDAIWSYGHRNIQAIAVDPNTSLLWSGEMGPQGGDELNLIEAGKNYGWPEVSWGEHYNGNDIPDPPTHPEFTDAVIHWTPVISPSGMDFYRGDMFPEWQGHMLIGGLTEGEVVIVEVNGSEAKEIDRIDIGARTRDVLQAPDGSIYVLTDENNGKVLRLSR